MHHPSAAGRPVHLHPSPSPSPLSFWLSIASQSRVPAFSFCVRASCLLSFQFPSSVTLPAELGRTGVSHLEGTSAISYKFSPWVCQTRKLRRGRRDTCQGCSVALPATLPLRGAAPQLHSLTGTLPWSGSGFVVVFINPLVLRLRVFLWSFPRR